MNPLILALLINGAAFTFDDGPSIKYTPRILKILKKHRVRAVFCIPAVGLYNKRKLKIAKQIVKEGHIICNHSYNHPNFANLSPKNQWRQISIAQKIIKKKLGVTPVFFRPPYGIQTKSMWAAIRYYKLKMLMWHPSLDSRDWSSQISSKQIYNKIIKNWIKLRKHNKIGVILFHDTNYKTALILESIILRVKKCSI